MILLAAAITQVGCTGDEAQPEEADMAEAVEDAQMEVQPQMPPSFVYIQHGVADFDAWLPVYDAFGDERDAAGVVAMWVYRDLDDPSIVHALHGASDVAALEAFTQMPELASGMQEAGVVGEPRFDFMNIVTETIPEAPIASEYNILVKHEVADWDAWKEAYDGHAEARAAAGLTSRGIARDAENPNVVYINFAASDLDGARAFLGSEDLKSTMEAAGVVGEPEIYVTETVQSM